MTPSPSATDLPGGFVGPLADDLPLIQEAMVRPYVTAIVLHRKGIRLNELLAALVPHLPMSDQVVGGWDYRDKEFLDGTRAEKICLNVLAEFVSKGRLAYREDLDLWEAISGPFWLTQAVILDAQLPQNLAKDY